MSITTLFMTVFNMSWTASVIIGIVLLLRLALRKAPRRFSYLLWAVVLFRLLCPFTLESVYSLPIFTNPANIPPGLLLDTAVPITSIPALANETIGDIANGGLGILTIYGGKTAEGEQIITQAVHGQVWPLLLGYVWVIGMGVMVIRGIVSYAKLRRRLVGAVLLRENIWLSDSIETPFVTGLFRPRIYLPSGLSAREQDYILLHERTHLRQGDHVFRLLAFSALCVHWFNPLVRLAFRVSGRDMEMSCDERVLSQMGADVKADYSESLLRLTAGARPLAATPLAFGEGDTESRVKHVLHYKKPALWVTILAAAGITAAILFLALNRAQTADITGVYVLENMTEEQRMTQLRYIDLRADGTAELGHSALSSYYIPLCLYNVTNGEVWLYEFYETDNRAGKRGDRIAVLTITADGALEFASTTRSLRPGARYVKEQPIITLPQGQEAVSKHIGGPLYYWSEEAIYIDDGMGERTVVSGEQLSSVFFMDVTGDDTRELVFYTIEDGGYRLHAITNAENAMYAIRYDMAQILEAELETIPSRGLLTASFNAGASLYTLRIEGGALVLFDTGETLYQENPEPHPTQGAPTIPAPGSAEQAASEGAVHLTSALPEETAPRALRQAVSDALMNDRDAGHKPGVYRTYAGTLLAVESDDTQVTAYLMALSLDFAYDGDDFAELGAGHLPMAMTFDTSGGGYVLKEVWRPRDGSYYMPDVQAKFPEAAHADALDTQKIITPHMIQCYAAVMDFLGADMNGRIAALLARICASPLTASNPQAYIDEHYLEYRELVYYGQNTLDYCFARFAQGGQTDLNGHIMAAACRDILRALGTNNGDGDFITGQAWYDALMTQPDTAAQNADLFDVSTFIDSMLQLTALNMADYDSIEPTIAVYAAAQPVERMFDSVTSLYVNTVADDIRISVGGDRLTVRYDEWVANQYSMFVTQGGLTITEQRVTLTNRARYNRTDTGVSACLQALGKPAGTLEINIPEGWQVFHATISNVSGGTDINLRGFGSLTFSTVSGAGTIRLADTIDTYNITASAVSGKVIYNGQALPRGEYDKAKPRLVLSTVSGAIEIVD